MLCNADFSDRQWGLISDSVNSFRVYLDMTTVAAG